MKWNCLVVCPLNVLLVTDNKLGDTSSNFVALSSCWGLNSHRYKLFNRSQQSEKLDTDKSRTSIPRFPLAVQIKRMTSRSFIKNSVHGYFKFMNEYTCGPVMWTQSHLWTCHENSITCALFHLRLLSITRITASKPPEVSYLNFAALKPVLINMAFTALHVKQVYFFT